MGLNLPFSEIWALDFEFSCPPGERPAPVCLVSKELLTGTIIRVWRDELLNATVPPFSIGPDSLFVAYYSSAEWTCFLSLGWPLPCNVLDLFVEFRCLTNGLTLPAGRGLLGALRYFGLDSIDSLEKEEMRRMAMSGGPWTHEEQVALLDYCESDVMALERLLQRMEPELDIDRALLRGRYMKAAARIEHTGIPIDTQALNALRHRWYDIQETLIDTVAGESGIYVGRTFNYQKFEQYLATRQIPWPRLESGRLDLTDNVFKDMSRMYPIINPLRELRGSLSKMRLADFAIGSDGRNRVMLSAFASKTGRNQPSNSRFIFGPSTWLRSLIRPEPEYGLAYIDFSQQEFGIAAALSDDPKMRQAYTSGDCYLEFGRQAGLIPPDGTKESHPIERGLCKSTVLAVQYGMGSHSLALRIGKSEIEARELLRLHHETYRVFWKWSDRVVDFSSLYGMIWTTFGWKCRFNGDMNARSVRNFPMQANGSEMLRLACILATEAGVRVCAPVHDALLVEFPISEAERVITQTQSLMEQASRVILDDFTVRTDVKRIDFPNRYEDERGVAMWNTVWQIINAREAQVG